MFPELLSGASKDELEAASQFGSYVFHEDHFLKLINSTDDEDLLARAARYLEYLCANENPYLRDLGSVALLEGLVSSGSSKISRFLGTRSRDQLAKVLQHFDVDKAAWHEA